MGNVGKTLLIIIRIIELIEKTNNKHQAMMNKQELEKIVKPLCWRSYDNGRVITAETVLKYNLKLEKVGECYLVHRIYSDNDCLEYNKPVSLETAEDIAWTAYLHTIGCIMETVQKEK